MSLIKCSNGFENNKEKGCKNDFLRPTIDIQMFPNTITGNYWSYSSAISYKDFAWVVNFSYGHVYGNIKTDNYYVRCVR